MPEYEYEVTFRGSQWTATVLIYHELDNETKEDQEANGDAIQSWAESVADQHGLVIGDYHEVSIVKTGVLTHSYTKW